MDNRIIENSIKFIERAHLKWEEVPAYVEVMQMLHSMLQNWEKQEEKPLQNAE